ncbi:MAG TPA: GHKL domain-containing protein [Candidatus Aphodocola excrementigallinarum]|uniref:GHKL domain-containing protein n=1 Tax=Candidatus Aphodocola excrementigallinarum TaxID=2840670 RepID=A0A9D1IQ98_9FIRM|nr:GHKL domain-containing protein [Candidatus Aphodocola excrementigallinarum]
MSMESIIVCIIASIFQAIATSYIIFSQKNMDKKTDKLRFIIIMLIYCFIGFLFIPNNIRFLVFLLVIFLNLYFTLDIRDKNVILYAFNTGLIFVISELIITVGLVIIGINSVDIVNNNFYNLIANVLISLFAVIFIKLPFVRKIVKNEITLFTKNKKLINYLYVFVVILYLIALKNGFELILKSNYYINILFMACVILIITIIIRNEFKYDKIKDEYKNMLNHVTKYEKIITDQGKANHEFKNQLMVIRGYAQMNSPKLIEYLDSVIKDSKKTHSSYLISQLNKFPAGGIKGLLYYKLSTMDDENIKHELNVESGVKIRLDTLGTETYKNITKVLGVLFDNAIDACKKSKEKKIIIDVVKKTNSVTFSIYNTYKGKIDMDKIGTGFTTKGSGHGYGLRLVKDIVENSNIFEIENSLEDEYYVTKLTIKTKNRQTKKKK